MRTHEPELADASVAPLTRPAAGLSSDTCFVTVAGAVGTREFVLRLPPAGAGLFPEYDLRAQVEFQNLLSRSGIPVPTPARYEPDVAWLGVPFMVMPRVDGRVVTTNPAYVRAGWLFDAPPAQQAATMKSFLETLARLHRRTPTPPTRAGLGELGRWSEYLEWAGTGAAIPGYLQRARDWCAANVPDMTGPSVALWGDVQLANCVFSPDGSVAALLDFELAGTGPPEMDLAWFLALHDMTVIANGGDLPGFGDRAEMIATYEQAAGRTVEALHWHEVFALLRSGSIMVRIARLLAAKGVDDSWLTRGNPTEHALTRRIGPTA